MLEGTKQFKRKKAAAAHAAPEGTAAPANAVQADPGGNSLEQLTAGLREESNATNLDRRQWFGSLAPAFGSGLVKLLRGSNNLQRDLHEALKEKASGLLSPPPEFPEK